MTAVKTATERGLEPHYKVRVVLPGAIIHLASMGEPKPIWEDGQLYTVVGDWLEGHDYGDTIGYIHWPNVIAVTWRWSP